MRAWIAPLVGVVVALVRNGQLVAKGWDFLIARSMACGNFDGLPRTFLAAVSSGYYYFSPFMMGRFLGPTDPVSFGCAVDLIQFFLWVAQLFVFRRIARTVTRSEDAADLSTLLFAWGTPLLYIVDMPYMPTAALGRSLGLTFALLSLDDYLCGSLMSGWVLAALGVYAHPGTCAIVLTYYAAAEALDPEVGVLDFAPRFVVASTLLIPVIDFHVRQAPLPPIYRDLALEAHGPALWTYGWSSWTLTATGAALIALGWRSAPRQARWLVAVAVPMLALRYLVRAVWLPRGWPLASVAIAVTSGFAGLTVAQYLGLPMAVAWCERQIRGARTFYSDVPAAAVAVLGMAFMVAGPDCVHSWARPDRRPEYPTGSREEAGVLLANCGAAAIPYVRESAR